VNSVASVSKRDSMRYHMRAHERSGTKIQPTAAAFFSFFVLIN
jgi:hypothetical protein